MFNQSGLLRKDAQKKEAKTQKAVGSVFLGHSKTVKYMLYWLEKHGHYAGTEISDFLSEACDTLSQYEELKGDLVDAGFVVDTPKAFRKALKKAVENAQETRGVLFDALIAYKHMFDEGRARSNKKHAGVDNDALNVAVASFVQALAQSKSVERSLKQLKDAQAANARATNAKKKAKKKKSSSPQLREEGGADDFVCAPL